MPKSSVQDSTIYPSKQASQPVINSRSSKCGSGSLHILSLTGSPMQNLGGRGAGEEEAPVVPLVASSPYNRSSKLTSTSILMPEMHFIFLALVLAGLKLPAWATSHMLGTDIRQQTHLYFLLNKQKVCTHGLVFPNSSRSLSLFRICHLGIQAVKALTYLLTSHREQPLDLQGFRLLLKL